ncbi:Sensors of blue-light using FAD [Jannaschia seosinensis]|uniref:Sensors of blue-light using FAD n=1 Tax=Jannaschia seosinensis TaxID=313367 RepID=A0A0M7B5W7_9RHOB|nr:BLUF domain-containing protein [Jannaschia seosinensis]CUH10006.1 Sensors of blue-light using FAD [Jannaschia seosinensis]
MHYFWIYSSRAKTAPALATAALLFRQARCRTPDTHLTGYLHREGDIFVQYIEGSWEDVRRLRHAILADPAHRDIRVVASGRIETRRFSGWSMMYTDDSVLSFRTYQAAFGLEPDIRRASTSDLLKFMEEMTISYEATGQEVPLMAETA